MKIAFTRRVQNIVTDNNNYLLGTNILKVIIIINK